MPRIDTRFPKNLVGVEFGRLKVREFAGYKIWPSGAKKPMWTCDCQCGGEKTVQANSLKSGLTQSCGCIHQETVTKHGHCRKRVEKRSEYVIHSSMLQRCHNPKAAGYSNYGGRGIFVCDRWRFGESGKTGYECFIDDVGDRPSESHTIDRIDNSGPYEPTNIRWATWSQQMSNQRPRCAVEIDGVVMNAANAGRLLGISESSVRYRKKKFGVSLGLDIQPIMPEEHRKAMSAGHY